jgi:large subunit ribosomal protein L18
LNNTLPRISVFRSSQHIYAQLIDDNQQHTVASCSSIEFTDKVKGKKEIAFEVGKELAQRARQKGIEAVVFDRGPFRFHGRVRSVAEGLREGGLNV